MYEDYDYMYEILLVDATHNHNVHMHGQIKDELSFRTVVDNNIKVNYKLTFSAQAQKQKELVRRLCLCSEEGRGKWACRCVHACMVVRGWWGRRQVGRR